MYYHIWSCLTNLIRSPFRLILCSTLGKAFFWLGSTYSYIVFPSSNDIQWKIWKQFFSFFREEKKLDNNAKITSMFSSSWAHMLQSTSFIAFWLLLVIGSTTVTMVMVSLFPWMDPLPLSTHPSATTTRSNRTERRRPVAATQDRVRHNLHHRPLAAAAPRLLCWRQWTQRHNRPEPPFS